MRIIVVIPARPPIIIVWINDIIALWAFHVAIGKNEIGPVIVPVARGLIMLRGILLVANLRIYITTKLNGGSI